MLSGANHGANTYTKPHRALITLIEVPSMSTRCTHTEVVHLFNRIHFQGSNPILTGIYPFHRHPAEDLAATSLNRAFPTLRRRTPTTPGAIFRRNAPMIICQTVLFQE